MTRYLKVSDGTTTINLDDPTVDGIQLNSYSSNLPGWKNGGVKQDSPISDDAKLVHRQFDAISDMAAVTIVGSSHDAAIANWRALLGMLEKAANYWLEPNNNTPVYIIKKGDTETTTHYALIYGYKIDELPNLYGGGFEIGANANGITYTSALVGVKIGIDHAAWSTSIPTVGVAASISSLQSWMYDDELLSATTDPADYIYSILQTITGKILASDDGQIWKSEDDGVTWALATTDPSGSVRSILQTTTGKILAGENGQIWKSEDDGVTWALATTDPTDYIYSILQTTTGKILAGGYQQIWKSEDDGVTWTLVTTSPVGSVYSLLQTTTGKILASESGQIWKSEDDGVTWTIETAAPTGPVYCLLQTTTGKILAGNESRIWESRDDGVTWEFISAFPSGYVNSLLQTTTGKILAGEYGKIWESQDDGIMWESLTTVPVDYVTSLLQTTTGKILAGEYGKIWYMKYFISMGTAAGSSGASHVANKGTISNLTHIFIDDGGAFGSNLLPMTSFPVTLLPAVPAINDAVYFIVYSFVTDTGPFDNLVLDIATPASSTTSYAIVYEYVSAVGAGPGYVLTWSTLATQDGTSQLSALGVNSIHWSRTQSPAWIPTGSGSINGITECWAIRARVSAITGTLTPPTQQNRNIYSCVLPYVDVASTVVNGDIPAIVEIRAKNQSDLDGAAGSAPNLYENRMVIGLRQYTRGTNFTPYINFSDEQNPFGITILDGDSSVFATDITAPTGRRITNTSALGDTSFADQITVTFGATIARDYYGKFRAFVRAKQTDGTVGDITHRLQVKSGSGGITYTSPEVQYVTKNDWQLLEFGEIDMPVSAYLDYDELGDSSVIALQTKNSSGAERIIYLYDLILMPADEWIIDAIDEAKTTSSIIGQVSSVKRYLDIDSISIPRVPIRALVRQDNANNFIVSSYKAVSGDRAILKPDVQQRLYFLAATSGSTTAEWTSNCEICHSIKVYKHERYLALVGNP